MSPEPCSQQSVELGKITKKRLEAIIKDILPKKAQEDQIFKRYLINSSMRHQFLQTCCDIFDLSLEQFISKFYEEYDRYFSNEYNAETSETSTPIEKYSDIDDEIIEKLFFDYNQQREGMDAKSAFEGREKGYTEAMVNAWKAIKDTNLKGYELLVFAHSHSGKSGGDIAHEAQIAGRIRHKRWVKFGLINGSNISFKGILESYIICQELENWEGYTSGNRELGGIYVRK